MGGWPLRVSPAGRALFDGSSPAALDPMLRVYLADMVRPYGVPLREDLLESGAGQSYGEMAGALLEKELPAGEPVDLLVLAFAVGDVVPGRATASHLSSRCPGRPAAFAVCDQGIAAPFTALRLIREYARTPGCRRALLIVTEQATLHYKQPAPAAVPTRHAAVALLCADSGPGRLATLRLRTGVGADEAAGALGETLAELASGAGGADSTSVILGAGAAGLAGGLTDSLGGGLAAEVIAASAGQPCTGTWWELAGRLPGWSEAGRRVLLADYEPTLGYLCATVIEVEAAGAAARLADGAAVPGGRRES
ncbi:MAG TPA: hypothetical protein VGG25_25280 [Streptosporangiaceae bacterium]